MKTNHARFAACGVFASTLVTGCTASDSTVEPGAPLAVTVVRNDAPVANARVVFSLASGALAATATTDGDGHASTALDVSQVTAIDPGEPTRLFTVAHVVPGAAVVIPLDDVPNPAQEVVATLSIAAPPGASPPGTDHYEVHTGCGTYLVQTLPATTNIGAGCIGADGNVPVVMIAATANLSLESPAQPLAAVAGLAAPAAGNFTLAPSSWSTSCTSIDVSDLDRVSLQLWQRYDGLELADLWPGYCHPAAAAGFDAAFPLLPLDDGLTAFSFGYVSGSLRMAMRTSNLATTPTSISATRAPDLLVGDADMTIDFAGATLDGSPELGVADVVIVELTYSVMPVFVRWRLVEPAHANEARFPDLPADISFDLASASDRIGELHYVDATWIDALADAQQDLPRLFDATAHAPPPAGTVREYREQFYPDAQ